MRVSQNISIRKKSAQAHNSFQLERFLLTFKDFSIPGMSEPMWSARQSGKTTTSSLKTENAPTC